MPTLNKAIFKNSNGNLTLICSRCSMVIKDSSKFNNDELLASKGLKVLPPIYCDKCKNFIDKSNDCGCK